MSISNNVYQIDPTKYVFDKSLYFWLVASSKVLRANMNFWGQRLPQNTNSTQI